MRNEGAVDRLVRILVGIGLLSLTLVGPRTPWALLGLVPLLTGILGYCPFYTALDVSTCRGARR